MSTEHSRNQKMAVFEKAKVSVKSHFMAIGKTAKVTRRQVPLIT